MQCDHLIGVSDAEQEIEVVLAGNSILVGRSTQGDPACNKKTKIVNISRAAVA